MPPSPKKQKLSEDLETPQELVAAVDTAVQNVQAIDVHTHLFPPEHGELMLWGIDELLTYHYLVSEFFMVAPLSITHESFFKSSKKDQATLVWEHLFIKRSPLSEAQIGVLTCLRALGLAVEVKNRDLDAIRSWYGRQDPSKHVDNVYKAAGIKYVVMTNVPFDPKESCKWLGDATSFDSAMPQTYNKAQFNCSPTHNRQPQP